MTRLFLVRHGATEWNETKRAQGQADIELSELGRKQAQEAARRLASADIAAVYSSDLKRASNTARAIAERHELKVVTDPSLREIDQGEWTGLSVDEIARRWPDWGDKRHHTARPGGESPDQVRERALGGLKKIVERHPDETVVVVSHGGTIRWVSAEAAGYSTDESARIRGLGNGGIVCITARIADGRLVLSDLSRMDGRTTDLDDPNQ